MLCLKMNFRKKLESAKINQNKINNTEAYDMVKTTCPECTAFEELNENRKERLTSETMTAAAERMRKKLEKKLYASYIKP